MADIFYGVDPNGILEEPTIDTSTTGKDIELRIDDGVETYQAILALESLLMALQAGKRS